MAEDKSEEPKDIYEQTREAGLKFLGYNSVVGAIKQGKFIPNLTDMAEQAAKEVEDGVLKEDGKINLQTDNVNQLYDYIAGASEKFRIRTTTLFENNLEKIIDATPQKAMLGIEKMLFDFAPKEKVDGEYKEIAKLHRQVFHMRNVWREYNETQSESRKKDLRDDDMVNDIIEYYNGLYKDGKSEELAKENAALLNASIKWVKRNPRLCEAKYQWLISRKTDEFKAKLVGLTYKEYKKLKDIDSDEKLAQEREIEAEIENETDEYVKQQHRQKRREQMKREHLPDKISKQIPDYLRNAMAPETLMNMYTSYWASEANQKG